MKMKKEKIQNIIVTGLKDKTRNKKEVKKLLSVIEQYMQENNDKQD